MSQKRPTVAAPLRALLVFALAGFCLPAGALECGLESAAQLAGLGAQLVGEVTFEPGREGHAIRLANGAAVSWPTAGLFEPRQGTLDMWVRPEWGGEETARRAFFHFGNSNSHCTLFHTEGKTVRFVYKASPQDYTSADVPVTTWKRGEWHHLVASWSTAHGDRMCVSLEVDGQQRVRLGGRVLSDLPERFYLGRRGGNLEHANALIDQFRLTDTAETLPYPPGPKPSLVATIEADARSGPLRRIHDFVTPWNSRETPLPFHVGDPWFQRLTEAQFRLVRLVAFSENWLWGVGLSRDQQGKLQVDWTDFDKLLDLVKAAGAEPYIRLAYHTPKILVQSTSAGKRADYALPSDLDEWSDLMYRIVKHCNVDRKLGIKYWVASLNEGDLTARRGQSDWQTVCELYERTVHAALRADPTIKVGGPAMANSTDGVCEGWFRQFIRFCRDRKLPLDFICTHAYHRAHPREYEEHVAAVKAMVHEEWPELRPEYFIDEFNQWARDKTADNEYGAAYMAAALHYQRRAGLDKSCVVSFNHFHPLHAPARVYEAHAGTFDKTATQSARFLRLKLTCENVERESLLLHPPRQPRAFTYADFQVDVPARGDPTLTFFTGLPVTHPGRDGVTFRLLANPGPQEAVLLDDWQRTTAWQSRAVSLAQFAGKSVTLRWAVDAGPNGSGIADWAAIGDPKLVVGGRGASQVAYDFLANAGTARSGVASAGYEFQYTDAAIRRYTGLPLIKGTVVTAPYFVYLMHSRMADQALPVSLAGRGGITEDDTCGVLASRDDGRLTVLVWHFDLMEDSPREVTLNLQGLEPHGAARLTRTLIDATHTNSYYDYVVAGKPSNNGEYNLKTGTLAVVEERTVEVRQGTAQVRLALPNMAVTLLELTLDPA